MLFRKLIALFIMVKLLLSLKQPKRDVCARIICKMEEIIQQIFQLHIFVCLCVCLKQNRNLNFFQTTKRKTGKKKGERKGRREKKESRKFKAKKTHLSNKYKWQRETVKH